MSDVHDLTATIEQLRTEKYPDLPAELVRSIIEAEDQYSDDRGEALKRIALLVDKYLNKE